MCRTCCRKWTQYDSNYGNKSFYTSYGFKYLLLNVPRRKVWKTENTDVCRFSHSKLAESCLFTREMCSQTCQGFEASKRRGKANFLGWGSAFFLLHWDLSFLHCEGDAVRILFKDFFNGFNAIKLPLLKDTMQVEAPHVSDHSLTDRQTRICRPH